MIFYILLGGTGYEGDMDGVYKFNKNSLNWEEVGMLNHARYDHGVTVVNKQDFEKACTFEASDKKHGFNIKIEPADIGLLD